MPIHTILAPFDLIDATAVCLLFLAWAGIGWTIENANGARPSVSHLMGRYRREWMVQMVSRQPRIFDSAVLSTLRQGTSFFASASMIAIGGGLALMGNTDQLEGVAEDLTATTAPELVWEIKIALVTFILANAFLRFVWSHRLFGYCAVVMASVPNDVADPRSIPRAAKAAEINITAARSFNRGLRAVYFALTAVAWMIGPLALIGATIATLFILWRREFASASRRILLDPDT